MRYTKKAISDVIGLHNKVYLGERIRMLEKRQQIQQLELAFLMTDIDNFGRYNNNYGHLQGDIALQEVAFIFKHTLESLISPGEHLFVARYGGEEFCAFIGNFQQDLVEVFKRSEDVRKKIENHTIGTAYKFNDEGYKKIEVTIAAGMLKPEENIKSLIKRVDDELKSKNIKGKNCTYLSI